MSKKNRGFYCNYMLTVDGEQRPPSTSQKKKKNPQNAFSFYMQDFREQEETRGRFYKTQKEVAEAAASSWKDLSEEDRKPYKEAAEAAKEKAKLDLHNKFTSLGKSYAQVDREEQELKEAQEKMLSEIQRTIRSLRTPPALSNYPFYMVHVNYYCKTLSGTYVPCELGVAEFTLIDGVKRVFRALINPGELPLGYKYESQTHLEASHKIPLPGNLKNENLVTDYTKILKDLCSFLREAKAEYRQPPLYTVSTQLEPCKNILANLCDSMNQENIFRVYPAKEMFFELQHACVEVFKPDKAVKIPYVSVTERELDKHIFDFTTGLGCSFHEGTDAITDCSSAIVARWSFLILDFCLKGTDIPLIPGKHVPQHTNVSQYMKLIPKRNQEEQNDATQLNAAMQKMDLSAGNRARSAWQQPGAADFGVHGQTAPVRAPKKVSQAISLLSPEESDDEFPALGSPGHKYKQRLQERE